MKTRFGLAACVLGMSMAGISQAATIGYWSFDDAAPGTNAGTLVTQVNSPDIDGVAGTNGTGALPIHDASLPGVGTQITNGVGGAVVNSVNAASLKFANTATSGYSDSGGKVTVQDPGASTLLEPAGDFTIEGFVRINNAALTYSTLVGKSRTAGKTSWTLDIGNSTPRKLRLRVDSLNGSVGVDNQGFFTDFNLSDNQWHHFAMTYTASERKIRLYGDYAPLTLSFGNTGVISNNGVVLYDDSPLYFGNLAGGAALDGFLDEIRYSDAVLTPDQFLVVIPEPATLGLMALGGLMMATRRSK